VLTGAVGAAIEWVVAALAGRADPADVPARLAPRLAARGDLAAFFAANQRFAAFREHDAEIEDVEPRGPWSARASVRTGPHLWELDVAVEQDPPHRIRSFQPRLAAADGVDWAQLAPGLREHDRMESELPGPLSGRIHARLLSAVSADCAVGLTAVLSVGGRIVHREYLGVSDLEDRRPLDQGSVFQVGSVAKTVTALAVLRLAERRVVDLDAPVRAYLPAGPVLVPATPADPAPTVAQLLLHRAGLTKTTGRQRHQGSGRLGAVMPRIPLAWAPGQRAEYSNIGFQILGELVQAVSGETFADFGTREVLEPLGLTHAGLPAPDGSTRSPATVTGHRIAAGRVAPAPPPAPQFPGSGGMTASAQDLVTLAGHFTDATDPLIRTALTLTTPAGPGVRFAPGIALLDRAHGPALWRGGATTGFTAEVLAAFDGSATVVLLTSKSPPDGVKALAAGLADELLRHEAGSRPRPSTSRHRNAQPD
jgi:CubicO group peptidase (beta-lactamase class C family)